MMSDRRRPCSVRGTRPRVPGDSIVKLFFLGMVTLSLNNPNPPPQDRTWPNLPKMNGPRPVYSVEMAIIFDYYCLQPDGDMKNILLIDNYDSFTANLEHLLALRLKAVPEVISYSVIDNIDIRRYDLIVISPGPGKPSEYRGYDRILSEPVAILGICLGMQIINEYFGGQTDRLAACIHGKVESIDFDGRRLSVARYHSLYVSKVAPSLNVVSRNPSGIPMALCHASRPIIGYQFHPESFLTEEGGYFIDYALERLGITLAG